MDALSTKSPGVSVIIPVRNRRDELRKLLNTLSVQHFPLSMFEVLVCDDGSTEDLSSVVDAVMADTGMNIRHLRQECGGPAVARNLGIRLASGDYLAFTDSDCEVDPGWLGALFHALSERETGIVGGPIEPHPASPMMSQCCNLIMNLPWGGGARNPRSRIAMRYHPRTGNAAISASLARRCGGLVHARHGEDVDFSSRVMAAGGQAVFAPGAIVYHNEHRSLTQIAVEAFWKGRARVRMWRSRGAMELIHTGPAGLVVYLLAAPCAATALPNLSWLFASPAIAYAVASVLVGCFAAGHLRSAAALPAAACCGFLMHMGYGLGMLVAIASRRGHESSPPSAIPNPAAGYSLDVMEEGFLPKCSSQDAEVGSKASGDALS